MDIQDIRMQLRLKSIYNIPLRVVFYARVSSDSTDQLNSLDNQVAYYRNFIKKNNDWTFVGEYVDEGLSGISTKKREKFNDMIRDGVNGKFDLVITKEISRFARNTLDSLQYTRELLNHGVGVLFQNDNICTFSEDAELRLTIMSSIAQDELRKLSSRVKFGHQQAIKDGVVLGNSRIFGYRKHNKRLAIDEDEAKMVKMVFELYASDQYSMKQIENILWDLGYRNHNGNKIAHTTLSGLISNPKYKGYYVGNKVKVIDMFTKKQVFLPQEQWVMYKDETGETVPAIVPEELWDLANEVLSRRSLDVKRRQGVCNHDNLLTGKLFCTHCGKPYYRKDAKMPDGTINSKWVCSGKIKNGASSCPSFTIYESEIKPVLFELFADSGVDVNEIINKYIEVFKSASDPADALYKVEQIKGKLSMVEKKQAKLLGYNVAGQISDEDYLKLNRQCAQEADDLQEELNAAEEQLRSSADVVQQAQRLKTLLRKATEDAANGVVNRQFVNKYIEKIYVTVSEGNCAQLDVQLFNGETANKTLKKTKTRTSRKSSAGHISKKICPTRTFVFKRKSRTSMKHNVNITYNANFIT